MIYGKITNGTVSYWFTADDNGKWQSGTIGYKTADGIRTRMTANEMINEYGLMPLVLPENFNGSYQDYNYKIKDKTIVLTELAETAVEENRFADLLAEYSDLKSKLEQTNYRSINYTLATQLGLPTSYTAEQMAKFETERLKWRNRINEITAVLKEYNL